MRDPREKILDAFLDEMLNETRPGRSSEEIAQHIREQLPVNQDHALAGGIQAAVEPLSKKAALTTPRQSPPVKQTSLLNWISIVVVAGLVLAGSIGMIALLNNDTDKGNLASETEPKNPPAKQFPKRVDRPNPGDALADKVKQALPKNPVPNVVQPQAPRLTKRDDVPANPDSLVIPPRFQRNLELAVAPKTPQQMAISINDQLHASWDNTGLQPAQDLDLRSWVNRLSSRLIGRTLTAEEMPQFTGLLVQGKPPGEIRQDLIRAFKDSPTFQSEFSEHWGKVLAWQMLGISPTMQTDDPEMVRTRDYLTTKIGKNEPLDGIAYDLISAVGSTSPSRSDYNPATNYLVGLRKRFGTSELTSAHIADTFLGREMQCIQCHDSTGNKAVADSKQREFYEFHAFFAQLNIEAVSPTQDQFLVTNRNYLPLGREGKVDAATTYRQPNGKEDTAFPRLGNFQPSTNGFVAKVDRRTLLAEQVTVSENFREAMVDHVWGGMLNLPLSGIDDNIAPEMAALRTTIAEQFAANQFNLDWLVTSIATCDAFLVGVGSEQQLADHNPFLGQTPQFNVFYSRLENRRSAIQSLTIVAQAYAGGDVSEALTAGLLARVDQTAKAQPNYILPFIPSKDSEWATTPKISEKLESIASSKTLTSEQKIEHLIQSALGRQARKEEVQQASIILKNSKNPRIALQDVWWSLLNSVDYKMPLAMH